MYALIDISNQMLEDSAFDHAGASLRKAGLAVGAERLRTAYSVEKLGLRREERSHKKFDLIERPLLNATRLVDGL